MNVVDRLTGLADAGAAWVMWLLVALSVLGVGVIVERAVVFWLSREDISKLGDDLASALSRGDVSAAHSRLEESPSFEARIAGAGLHARTAQAALDRVGGASAVARLEMERNLAFLGTLGNNAPFVGLLGTVIGVVRAFHALGLGGGHVSADLMREIGEALIATAIGLIVALPAVVFFNLFQRIIRARLTRGEALASEIVAHLRDEHGTAS